MNKNLSCGCPWNSNLYLALKILPLSQKNKGCTCIYNLIISYLLYLRFNFVVYYGYKVLSISKKTFDARFSKVK
jgi:hypothetical protein